MYGISFKMAKIREKKKFSLPVGLGCHKVEDTTVLLFQIVKGGKKKKHHFSHTNAYTLFHG